jgi:5-methylcytosine-specific restriction endonuclease McrA
MKSALVLTSSMIPHKVYQWHKSVCAELSGDVDVLERYADEPITCPSFTIYNPAVLRIKKSLDKTRKRANFSRSNLYNHYKHKCAYCGRRFKSRDLTFDHVMPRSRGGPTDWSNVVAACGGAKGCNARKDDRTPEEAGMRLLYLPKQPTSLPIVGVIALPRHVPELWLPYLEGHRTMQAVG